MHVTPLTLTLLPVTMFITICANAIDICIMEGNVWHRTHLAYAETHTFCYHECYLYHYYHLYCYCDVY